jgi:S1 RNA binding domain protein
MPVEVGSVVEGRVTGITNFGAFVELNDGQTGLVHISEVADTYVKNIHDYLKQNERVRVKVIAIREGKIGLSIRQVDTGKKNKMSKEEFEQKLASFLKESDERQQDLKRSIESKRGGRGSRNSAF